MDPHNRALPMMLCAILFALCAASQAKAGEFGPGRPFGEAELAALTQAEAYWGRQPDLCTSRSMEIVAPGALGVDEQGNDVGARATRPAVRVPCGMWVEEDELGVGLCSLVRHEYGHWLGFGHEDPELAEMPGCLSGSTEASGGSYIPPDPKQVTRQQNWELFREWRAGCQREKAGSRARRRCFAAVGRYRVRLQKAYQ